jgi:GrpB-like predicted nucleotidyltransferase (UPF0157 family)
MKALPESPEEYFEKFDTCPVSVAPFDPRSTRIAVEYLNRLRALLEGLDVELTHRGSTAFGIAGKGDVELGVFPSVGAWEAVLKRLLNIYGPPGNSEEDYVRFNDVIDDHEIEIIVLRGYQAEVDKRLTGYLLGHPQLLKEYENVKRMYSYSKREYQKTKDAFLRSVVEMIPEEPDGG